MNGEGGPIKVTEEAVAKAKIDVKVKFSYVTHRIYRLHLQGNVCNLGNIVIILPSECVYRRLYSYMAKRKTPSPACSACRVQRKKCSEECMLAPHFPADDPRKFAIVQSVFGTSHIVRLLQSLTAEQRTDAVNSMVYEATARVDDPVHGCARTIHQMQKRIPELEAQLAATQEDLKNMRCEYDQLKMSYIPLI